MVRPTARRIAVPLALFMGAVAIYAIWDQAMGALGVDVGGALERGADLALRTLLWILGALFLSRLVEALVWRFAALRRDRAAPPKLVADLIAGAIWLGALFGALSMVFEQSVAALLATSGVLIAVVGFALRDTLSGLVAGVAMSVEHPYDIGDWIAIGEGEEALIGEVVDVSWLTTRLVTRNQVTVVAPNSQLALSTIRNFSAPEPWFRDQLAVTLPFDAPPEQAERVILAALRATPEAMAAPGRAPDVVADGFDEAGVRWLARFWVASFAQAAETRSKVQRAIMRHLRHAGLTPAYPRRDLARIGPRADADADPALAALSRDQLFGALTAAELERLAVKARRRVFAAGAEICREGEDGHSLFVLVEGLVRGSLAAGGGFELGPGASFGEMSLLTGAPRGASVTAVVETVCYEIEKIDLAPLLAESADLAEAMSRIMAERQDANLEAAERGDARADAAAEAERLAERLLDRIGRYFGLDLSERVS